MIPQTPKILNVDGAKFDRWLLFSFLALLSIGVVMVASASIPITERMQLPMFYFTYHQALYIAVGLGLFWLATLLPIEEIQRYAVILLIISLLLLVVILIPGVTRIINGSIRWLFIGPISVQPSEIVKVALIAYMASYMVRRSRQLHSNFMGFVIPMGVLSLVAFLLMLEPDFGAVVIVTATVLGMLFLGGVQFNRFLALLPFVIMGLGVLTVSSSYRLQRLIAFRDPWADQFDTGYQLVQALIAVGRGAWFGTGLGGSIQKLLYLPESHSDFIFAVLAEELGLVGALTVLGLYALFIFRGMQVGRRSHMRGLLFGSYLAYGITLLIGLQAAINIGVNIGLLPTKGLTLPFLSCGGSSMLIACMAVGVLFRVDYEARETSKDSVLKDV